MMCKSFCTVQGRHLEQLPFSCAHSVSASMALNQGGSIKVAHPAGYLATVVFPRVLCYGFSLKHCGYAVLCSFWVSQDHRPAHLRPAQLEHMLSLTSCSGQEWQPRERLLKNVFFASCSSSSNAHVAVE